MNSARFKRQYQAIIIVSVFVIILNILLFFYYWSQGFLNPSISIIQRYSIIHNDPSACRMAYSPLYCLNSLKSADSLAWNFGLLRPDVSILEKKVTDCTPIKENDLRLLCECDKNNSCSTSICHKIRNHAAFNDCIRNAAVAEKNPDICNILSTQEPAGFNTNAYIRDWQQAMLLSCLERVGRATRNISICDRLSDSFRKGHCIEEIKSVIDATK